MRFAVYPYRAGSAGARNIANNLPNGRVLRLQHSRFVPRRGDVVINWGNTTPFPYPEALVLNPPETIREASNKLSFFQRARLADPDIIPAFWTRREDIPRDAYPIVCRTVLAGHSGEGIIIVNNEAELVAAPLYVAYVKKQEEYRIHVGREARTGTSIIISIQRKARRLDVAAPNWQIRNHSNGFIYARENVVAPECVLDCARRALLCTSLDFGAVDVVFNERGNYAKVLEINTAPGNEGQTGVDYARYFTSQFGG